MSTRPVNLWASLLFVALVWALELPPLGWQLFILGSSQSDSTAFPSFLDTYATRLLAEPLRRLMCNCRIQRRSRTLMLAPNLRPKVVPHSGSRVLPRLIVRARGLLVAGAPSARCPQEAWPSGVALRERGVDARHTRPVASLPQRARLLEIRSLAPAFLLPYPLLPEPVQPEGARPCARAAGAPGRCGPDAHRPRGSLPRHGHHPRPCGGEGKGMQTRALRRAGILRTLPLQNRVGLRLQGRFDGGP